MIGVFRAGIPPDAPNKVSTAAKGSAINRQIRPSMAKNRIIAPSTKIASMDTP